ncbi:hypothetical protein [Enterobacter soli]|uniref:hypothetical protein n=1 Tax=Enterobacter soli TaxID=885040 RepID=UPI0034CDEB8E
MKNWADDLICAHVDCDAEQDIIETLRDLGNQGLLAGWRLEPLNIPGGFPWCLSKGGIQVALVQTRKNIAMTSNVFPSDPNEDAASSNIYIKQVHEIFNNTNGVVSSNLG